MPQTVSLKAACWLTGLVTCLFCAPTAAQTAFRLLPPTLLCANGFIEFNTTGGDGTTITYSTTGVTLDSPTSTTGIVQQAYRNNPAPGPAVIEATQSGIVSRFNLDVPYYCGRTFLYPVRRVPIPDITATQNEAVPVTNVGKYFTSNDPAYAYRAFFSYKIYGLPPGLSVNTATGRPPGTVGFDTAYAYVSGIPTLAGSFPIVVIATNQGAFTDAYSVADTFLLTVRPSALPVDLVSFTAKAIGQYVELRWLTSQEKNNKGFVVERSKELLTFETVGELASEAADKSASTSYRLTDYHPINGTSYYRLTQIDRNNQFKRYPVVSIVFRERPYSVSPNPLQGSTFQLELDEPETAQIAITDLKGQHIDYKRLEATRGQVLLKLGRLLPAGLYLIRVTERGQTRQHRLLID